MTTLTYVSRMPYRLFTPSISNARRRSVSRNFHSSAVQKRISDTGFVSRLILGGDQIDINLGGYHMSPSSARAVNKTLGINDTQFKDFQLRTPINNWLADNKAEVLGGCLTWDFDFRSSRVFFFTHFCDDWEWPEEDEEDLRVKNWLQENGATGTEWIALYDEYGFTQSGLQSTAKWAPWPEVGEK